MMQKARCKRCGSVLTDPRSIERGMGEQCAEAVEREEWERFNQLQYNIFDFLGEDECGGLAREGKEEVYEEPAAFPIRSEVVGCEEVEGDSVIVVHSSKYEFPSIFLGCQKFIIAWQRLGIQTGDTVHIKEVDVVEGKATGQSIEKKVTHVSIFSDDIERVVLSLEDV